MKGNLGQFIAVETEIFRQIEEGSLTPTEFSVYCTVLDQVDYKTGFWNGSSAKIEAAWGGNLSKRTIQRALSSLCRKGYLKSFHQKNSRGNYRVAVNGYGVRFGPKKGLRLNANATTVPQNPVYAEGPANANEPTEAVQKTNASADMSASIQALNTSTRDTAATHRVSELALNPASTSARNDTERPFSAPNLPRILDIDSSKHKTTPPRSSRLSRPGTAWLAGEVEKLLIRTIGADRKITVSEHAKLGKLEQEHGTLSVLLAFRCFVRREEGFEGLKFPLALFGNEVDLWLAKARKQIACYYSDDEFSTECPKIPDYVQGAHREHWRRVDEGYKAWTRAYLEVCGQYGYPTDFLSLALLDAVLSDDEGIMEEYQEYERAHAKLIETFTDNYEARDVAVSSAKDYLKARLEDFMKSEWVPVSSENSGTEFEMASA